VIAKISQQTDLRITVIHKSGQVLDDSYLEKSQIASMENHETRPEVRQAIFGADGHSIRFSKTAKMEMIYFAKMLDQGLVLRIAYPAKYITDIKREFSKQSFSIFLLLFLVTGGIAVYLGRKIAIPVQRMNFIAENLEAGKEQIHFPQFYDPTMQKIAGLIYRIYNAMILKQEQLKQEQEKLNHTFSILEEGIILLDMDHEILHFNPRAEEFLGMNLENKKNLLKDFDDFEMVNFFHDILNAEDSQTWNKKEYKAKQFDVNLRVLPTEKLIVFLDVSDASKYEHFKSELIGNISHELRTPLAMIMGYSETILSDREMPEKVKRRFLTKIHNNSKRINHIIDDLLILHKLENTEFKFTIEEPANITEIIEDLNDRYGDDASCNLHFQSEFNTLNILDTHINSVLTNLIENAIKYSGGNNIHASIVEADGRVLLSVEDEGPVIPLQERERVFERFYTVSRSRNKSKSGTGLGLPIVKHIAQLYHGNVTITDGEKGGNKFSVYMVEKQ